MAVGTEVAVLQDGEQNFSGFKLALGQSHNVLIIDAALLTKTNCIMAYVKNAKGTSRWTKPSTGESTWLEYWENQTGTKATRCGATDCHSTSNLVGAHVQLVNGGNELYITPLCSGCNQRTDYFYVDTTLVRVPSGQ